MKVSEGIFELAGLFEKLRETGVRMSPQEARWLFEHLSALGMQAKANETHHSWACEQIEELNREIIETGGAPDASVGSSALFAPSFKPVFSSIQGGKA